MHDVHWGVLKELINVAMAVVSVYDSQGQEAGPRDRGLRLKVPTHLR